MAKPQNKPWSKGYIPPTKPRKMDAAWTAPETPEGWHRNERMDCVEFEDNPFGPTWRVIGLAGKPWRVYKSRRVDASDAWQGFGRFKYDEVFKAASFDVCMTWVSIEQANEPEPKPWRGMDYGPITGRSSRQGAGKSAVQLAAYRAMCGVNDAQVDAFAYGTQMHKALLAPTPERLLKAYQAAYPELLAYCRSDVDMSMEAFEQLKGKEFTTVVIDESVEDKDGEL